MTSKKEYSFKWNPTDPGINDDISEAHLSGSPTMLLTRLPSRFSLTSGARQRRTAYFFLRFFFPPINDSKGRSHMGFAVSTFLIK